MNQEPWKYKMYFNRDRKNYNNSLDDFNRSLIIIPYCIINKLLKLKRGSEERTPLFPWNMSFKQVCLLKYRKLYYLPQSSRFAWVCRAFHK